MGFFYDWLDRKIRKIPKYENLKKSRKHPEKSRKSQNPGDRDLDLKIPPKSQENPRDFSGFLTFRVSLGFLSPESVFFSWDGISRQKATSASNYDLSLSVDTKDESQ